MGLGVEANESFKMAHSAGDNGNSVESQSISLPVEKPLSDKTVQATEDSAAVAYLDSSDIISDDTLMVSVIIFAL